LKKAIRTQTLLGLLLGHYVVSMDEILLNFCIMFVTLTKITYKLFVFYFINNGLIRNLNTKRQFAISKFIHYKHVNRCRRSILNWPSPISDSPNSEQANVQGGKSGFWWILGSAFSPLPIPDWSRPIQDWPDPRLFYDIYMYTYMRQ